MFESQESFGEVFVVIVKGRDLRSNIIALPKEILKTVEVWIITKYNIVHVTDMF